MIGLTIDGRYRLEAKLGSGGMGDVYRASRLLIGDEVAVKILHTHDADPVAAERFQREAQAAARIKHANAVNIYDFGVTNEGLQYLVMELVAGISLRNLIKEHGPILPSLAIEIIKQTCLALREAHRNNVIHRDLKPDNIIVDTAATELRVKVLDFGIAKIRDDLTSNLTQTGSVLGTPHYMSPEQCLGEELDHRSDIYSLGIVLYEMLTGTVPFRSPTPAAVIVQHVNQPPVPPSSLNASIPLTLQSAMLRALEKQREARPQSAQEFSDELANALAGSHSVVSPRATNDQNHSMPTIVLGQQSLQSALPTNSTSAIDTSNNPLRIGSGTIVIATLLATVFLLVLGGLMVWLIKGTPGRPTDLQTTQNQQLTQEQSQMAREVRRTNDAPATTPATEVLAQTFTKQLRGAIGKYGVEMTLHRTGSELSGTYVYTKYRSNITITGSIDGQRNVEMYGYDNRGLQIDIFKGRFVSPARIEGHWSKPNGTRTLPFSLIQQN